MADPTPGKLVSNDPIRSASRDWELVRRRVTAAQAALEGRWEKSPEDTRRILRARAQELAREPAGEIETGEFLEVVEFLVGGERYGVESRHVREIHPVKELTTLPGVPSFVLGVINLRGRIVSVVDFKRLFELPEKGLSDMNKAVIISAAEMELGILADEVTGLRRIPAPSLQPSLPTLTEIRAEYLRGVSADRLVVLDAEKILADSKLVVRDQAEP